MFAMTRTHSNRDPFFNLVDRFFAEPTCNSLTNDASSSTAETGPRQLRWVPPVDIVESTDAFVVTADLPGLSKEDIDISLEGNMLTVSGERSYVHNEESDTKFRRVERAHGTFRRSFRIPAEVDASKVEAGFANGVLTLTMPKADIARSRKIEVA